MDSGADILMYGMGEHSIIELADALASGATILTYGSQECGIIEYMQSTKASFVCTQKEQLVEVIKDMLSNKELQKQYYDQQIVMTAEHHNLKKSCEVFENVVKRAMKKIEENA